MSALTHDETRQIEAAFEAAQARTSAPLVGVAAQISGDYAALPLALAFVAALALPWPLLIFTDLPAERIFAAQLALALVALAIFSFPRMRLLLSPGRVRRGLAHRAALAQFALRVGDHRGGEHGVLIYVSLAEHYVRIIPGAEAARLVPATEWQALVNRLTSGIAKGDLKGALERAASEAGDTLAPHFPPTPNRAVVGGRFHVA